MSRIHRFIVVAGTVLATAAIATGPADAESHHHAGAATHQDLRSPDSRDAAAGVTTITGQDIRSPDARDAAERRAPVIVRVERAPRTGLSWDSIGLGALLSAGLLISIAGAYVLIGRRRTHGPHVA